MSFRKIWAHDGSTRTYEDGVLTEGTEPVGVLPAHTVMADIPEFRSPIDDSVIGSRSHLREHNARHGVAQCGELKGKMMQLQEKRLGWKGER